jgi:hypothetical protein
MPVPRYVVDVFMRPSHLLPARDAFSNTPAVPGYLAVLEETRPYFNDHFDRALRVFPHLPNDEIPPYDELAHVMGLAHDERMRLILRGSRLAEYFATRLLRSANQGALDRLRLYFRWHLIVASSREISRYLDDCKSFSLDLIVPTTH